MPAKAPNPIDVYVGGRVRMRRIEVEMSQQTLGGHIDLTFQQIQKYEKGMNRIADVKLRRSVVDLVERLATIGKNDPPRPRRARPKRK